MKSWVKEGLKGAKAISVNGPNREVDLFARI
jgi:hypothetical protein